MFNFFFEILRFQFDEVQFEKNYKMAPYEYKPQYVNHRLDRMGCIQMTKKISNN